MFKRNKICSGLALAFGGALAVTALPGIAQTSERVEVTGSRIKTIEVEGASPVTTLSAETIKVDAVRSVESMLNNLPQVFADYGGQVSNGATGTATVNLRNLGRDRTLVLVNGRRLPAGSPSALAPDLNQIPVPLIKRVEVLTGGASAVYGSDAVAGVVNFIMNDRFEGIQVELNHQFNNHQQRNTGNVATIVAGRAATNPTGFKVPGDKSADGEISDIALTMGGNFAGGKGNATVFLSYKKEDALLQSERDFSACSLGAAGAVFTCGGSSTSFPGRFLTDNGSFTVADANGKTRAFAAATDQYNFGPLNYFQRPSERYSMAAFGRYDINDKARVYTELSFHDDHTVAQIAPSGLFFGNEYTIRYENPLLSPEWRTAIGLAKPGDSSAILIGRRNVEGGGRQDDLRHTSFRMVTGVKGDIGAWNYDAFTQVGKVIYQETYKNDFSIARATKALDVVRDASGNIVCRSVVDGTDPNCVPYNIWSLGKVTPAALAYLQTPGFKKGFTHQAVTGFNVGGDLGQYGFKLPGAKNGVGVAFGFERRSEKMELSTDTAFTTGDLAGQGGPTIGVAGQYSIKDYYAEVRVPIMEQQPMAHLLSLSASYRNSDISTGQKTDTYGAGLEWAPVKAVRFRGSYQRAARAANIIELYAAQSLGLYNNDEDPCAGARPSATLAQCQRTGVTAAQYGTILDSPAGQYNALFGGNPNLKPEQSNSTTMGVVLNPVRDLTVTVDYFKIKVKDAIDVLDPTIALQQCLATGDPVFCNKINRDSRGTLWISNDARILATNANLAKRATEGVDIGAEYRMALGGMGRVDFTLNGTFLKKFEVEQTPGLGTYDCAGLFGNTCGTPAPEWRHKLRGTWATPWNFDMALTWRYFGKVNNEVTSSNPLLAGTVNAVEAKFPAINYIDIAGSYNLTKNVTLRASVANLFDKDPPLAVTGAPFGNGNTYPVVYEAFGRRISLNLTATF